MLSHEIDSDYLLRIAIIEIILQEHAIARFDFAQVALHGDVPGVRCG